MPDTTGKARVGRTRLWVSRVGLGTAPIGNLYKPVDEDVAISTVKRAIDMGLTHIDTAPLYGFGLAEERVGKALSGVAREKFTLSTKVGRILTKSDGPTVEKQSYWAVPSQTSAAFDFSAKGIMKSLEGSMKRLMMTEFDVLLLHDCDQYVEQALREAYPVLSKLRDSGKVKAIGAGLNSVETALKLAKREQFDCFLIAGRYTLLEQGAQEEFLPFCHDEKIGVFIGGPFNSGILASDPTPDSMYNYERAPNEILEKARKIKHVCDKYGVPLRAAALQFVIAHPTVTSVIIGCRSPVEVTVNKESLNFAIPSQLWEDLKAEGLLREDAPTP